MANLVKPKLATSLICIALLVLIALLETNFYATTIIKRWGTPLTWNDFKGIPPVFSQYEAAINSYIYLEYDSSISQYRAFAAQFDTHSWTRTRDSADYYLLNHEQYHFNISELHARMMNDYIKKNPEESAHNYRMQLASLKGELNYMQDLYDQETDHSLIINKQRRWEYTVDSLLQSYSSDSGWAHDPYTGAKIYFSSPPTFETGLNVNGIPYREYTLNRYWMELSLMCFQHTSFRNQNLDEFISNYYKKLGLKVKALSHEEQNGKTKISVIARDSSNYAYHETWVNQNSIVYKALTKFTTNTADTIGYYQIARSFLNSFNVEEVDQYWLSLVKDSSQSKVTVSPIIKVKSGTHENCITVGSTEYNGFYKDPIFDEKGTLFIPYDVLNHPDSVIEERILLHQGDVYTYETSLNGIIYFIPFEKQPKEPYTINFGYTIKGDSSKCRTFYNQILEINPSTIKTN